MSLQSRLQNACIEVAIEGSKGATLDQFWTFITEFQDNSLDFNPFEADQTTNPNFVLDIRTKEWIWSELLKVPNIYFQNPSTKQKLSYSGESYSEVESKKDTFNIYADTDLQMKTLLGNSTVAYVVPKETEILQYVMQSRESGVTQKALIENLTKNSKNTFSLLKRLLAQKLVFKLPIVHNQAHTHLYVHHRFLFQNGYYLATLNIKKLHSRSQIVEQDTISDDENLNEDSIIIDKDEDDQDFEISLQGDDLKIAITELLFYAKDQTMYVDQMCEALGIQNCNRRTRTRLNRLIHNLVRQQYLLRFVVTTPTTGHLKRCVKALKLYQPSTQSDENFLTPQSKLEDVYMGQPLYSQFLDRIIESGIQGCTLKDLAHSAGGLSIRYIEKAVERLDNSRDSNGNRLIRKVNEFQGRVKYNRFYSDEIYQTIQNLQNLDSTIELDKNVQDIMSELSEKGLITSKTVQTRYEVIIDLLWNLKVCKIDADLLQAAKDQFTKRGIKSGMDKRTLATSMQMLEKKGIVTKYNLQTHTLAGQNITFDIFYLSRYTESSSEVQTWINDHYNRNILNIPKKPHSSEPRQQVDIEPWEDIKQRIDPNKLAFFEGAGKMIGSIPSQTASQSEFQDPGSEKYWLVSALKTGYVHATMIRARILHMSMLEILNKYSLSEMNTTSFLQSNINPDRIISTEMLFKKMTLQNFMNLIVIGRPTEELFQYITEPANLKLRLEDLPTNIKKILFSTYTKYKSRMKTNMGILLDLGLVYPVKRRDDESNMPYQSSREDVQEHLKEESLVPFYFMVSEVQLYDYGIENYLTSKIHTCEVKTMEQAKRYWSDLEWVATRHSKTTDNNAPLPPEVAEVETRLEKSRLAKQFRAFQPISIIRNSHHWKICYSHSPEQRKFLESFVDRKRGLTPLHDISKCQYIASCSGLSLFHVTQYFKKIQKDYVEKRKAAKTARLDRIAKIKEAADNTNRVGKSGKVPMHSRAMKLAMVSKTHINLDPDDDAPFIPDDEGFNSQVILQSNLMNPKSQYEQQKTRLKVCQDHDFHVLLVFTILKFRAYRDNITRWIGTIDLFPNTHREFCRRRISTLLKQPSNVLKLSHMMSQWKELYPEAIRTGALEEKLYDMEGSCQVLKPTNPHPLDPYSYLPQHIAHSRYNLKEQLSYFEKNYIPGKEEKEISIPTDEQQSQKFTPTFQLPKNHHQIPELFYATAKSDVNLSIQNHHYFLLPHISLATSHPLDLTSADKGTLSQVCQTPMSKIVVAHKGHLEYSLDAIDFFEDRYDVKNSIKSRALLSFVISQTCRFNFISLDDPALNHIYPASLSPSINPIYKINPQEYALSGLIKIILFSSDSVYNSTLAQELLQVFPEKIFGKVLNDLNQMGVITRRKTAVAEGHHATKPNMFLNRVIPGRSLHMSDRFLLVVMGPYQPGILRQAGYYLQRLTNYHTKNPQTTFTLSPFISSAGMVTLLDILASDHVHLVGQLDPTMEFSCESARVRKQNYDTVTFDIKLQFKNNFSRLSFQNGINQGESSKRNVDSEDNTPKKQKSNQCEPAIENSSEQISQNASILDQYPDNERQILLRLYHLISQSESMGFPEMHLARTVSHIAWNEFQRYLHVLKSHSLAEQVGLDVKRWILPKFAHHWKVNLNSKLSSTYVNVAAGNDLEMLDDYLSPKIPSPVETKYVNPRIWIDLNGDRNAEMYLTMMDLVLRTIVSKPGITRSNIVRKLDGALTLIELGELIDHLTSIDAIYSKRFIQPPKPSLFSKTKVFQPVKQEIGQLKISEMEGLVTSYWPTSQCYEKFCRIK